MGQNVIRKAAAEDKEHGVAQKSPINNVANKLYIIINEHYHGNMYDKHIIVGGQSSTANRTDSNRVSTTRRILNQLEM